SRIPEQEQSSDKRQNADYCQCGCEPEKFAEPSCQRSQQRTGSPGKSHHERRDGTRSARHETLRHDNIDWHSEIKASATGSEQNVTKPRRGPSSADRQKCGSEKRRRHKQRRPADAPRTKPVRKRASEQSANAAEKNEPRKDKAGLSEPHTMMF